MKPLLIPSMRPALVTETGETLTYAALIRRTNAAAGYLHRLGVLPGERVCTWLPATERHVVTLSALWQLGAVACPLSLRLPEGTLAERMRCIGAQRVVTDRDVPCRLPPPPMNESDTGPEEPPDSGRAGAILFTSGSTGEPKGVWHTLSAHRYSALGSNQNIRLGPGDRWLVSLSLHHVGGLAVLFRCFAAQAAAVLAEPGEAAARLREDPSITHVSLVTTQLLETLNSGPPPPGLKAVLLGGSAFPEGLPEQARSAGWPLHTSYGLTETASQVTATGPKASRGDLGSSGRLLPYRELSIDAEGEILVRGRILFNGYATPEGVDIPLRDGWFHTGDLGRLDDEGRLHVTGRRDNRFISGGENIHPETIERALLGFKGIIRTIVAPAPDARFGFRPVAFIDFVGGASGAIHPLPQALHEALTGYLAERIERFRIPTAFFTWPPDAPDTPKPFRPFFTRLAAALSIGEGET